MPSAHIAPATEAEMAAVTIPFSAVSSGDRQGSELLKRILAENGFAVVTDVMPADECKDAEALWGKDLLSIVDESIPASRAAKRRLAQDPVNMWPLATAPLGTKFASDYGLPQGQLAWSVRTNPNVKRVFENIYTKFTMSGGKEEASRQELCCGTDNIFFNNERAPNGEDGERESALWPHIDLNKDLLPSSAAAASNKHYTAKNEAAGVGAGAEENEKGEKREEEEEGEEEDQWDVFQGVLYVWEASADSSTTVVWPKSHLEYETLSVRRGRDHFIRIPDSAMDAFELGARRVLLPAGALLLWDSKTVHQGWPHGPRLAVPVCFEPSSRRSPTALSAKAGAVSNGLATTHWASLGIVHHANNTAHRARHDAAKTGLTLSHTAHLHALVPPSNSIDPKIFALL